MKGDGWNLIHGDAFDLLTTIETKSIDHTISDPPYSAHVETGQAVSGRRSGQAVIRKEKIGVGWLDTKSVEQLCAETVRVTKGWILLFCAWEQIAEYQAALELAGGRYVRACGWEKPDGTPQLTGDRPATWGEAFVLGYGTRGALRWNGGGKRGLYRAGVCRGEQRSDHPTQKPLMLMRALVEDFTDSGDLVLDPFAGSGTTGVACRMLRRKFIGFELDEDFYKIACRRLRGDESKPIPEQPSLFDRSAS